MAKRRTRSEDSTAGVGRCIFHWSIGDEEFTITRARIDALHREGSVCLNFEVQTDGKRVRPAGDALKFDARPWAEVVVQLPLLDPEKLVGRQFHVRGYNDVAEEQEAMIFYDQHDLLINNVIDILNRDGNLFQVRWVGVHTDLWESYVGESVEIVAWFAFADMEQWLPGSR